jgi:hypothetical protein
MLRVISDRLYRWTKGWLILVLFLLDALLGGFLLPLAGGMMQGGQGGIQPLDLMFFATPARIFDMLAKYGEYGRPFYRTVELTLDVAYPLVYSLFFGMLISWFFQRGVAPGSALRRYNVTPLVSGLFDLLENAVIVVLLSIFPSQPAALAWILITFTSLKWLFAGTSIALLVLGLALAARNRFQVQA